MTGKIKKGVRVVFADLDGTLIKNYTGETFGKGVWDMVLRFDVLEKLKEMAPKYVVIVTNQNGIEKGYVDLCHFERKLDYVCACIEEYVGCMTLSYYCTSGDDDCPERKPNPGMLDAGYKKLIFRKEIRSKDECIMIGDASGKEGQWGNSDLKAAENFGIDYYDADDFVNMEIEM